MQLDWLDWSNPVAVWWVFLVAISALNISLLFVLRSLYARQGGGNSRFAFELLFALSAAYVLGCAFRSILPRADVQRICLFDTWLSSVLVGRSVATVAELCFALQWALVLRELGRVVHSDTAQNIARMIVPLITLAEISSWYAVISADFLGNVLENSLWTVTFVLVAVALLRLLVSYRGPARLALAAMAAGTAGYIAFMLGVDVPMYVVRWQAPLAEGAQHFGFFAGLHDLATRWIVTYDIAQWRPEIAWLSLYFSLAVWTSLLLGGFGLVRHALPRYRIGRPLLRPAPNRQPAVVTVRSS